MRTTLHRRTLVAAGCLALAALALAVAARGGADGAPSPAGWEAAVGVSGRAVAASPLARLSATDNGVDPAAIREVATASVSGERYRLLTGPGPNGEACFSLEKSNAASGDFDCLGELAQHRGALIEFAMFGGSSTEVVDRAVVFGLARGDVRKIVVTTRDGSTYEPSLNRWRAFAYVAETAGSVPAAVAAYRADGTLLDELRFSAAPPS